MAKLTPATTKNSSPLKTGKNPNNLPAESYDKNGVGSANMEKEIEYNPNTTGELNISLGNISKGKNVIKTQGVETRGNGAATKGRKAYGPMA